MNGLNAVGGASGVTGPSQADSASFDAIFAEGVSNTSAVLLQFLGGDILQSVMRDESSVD